MLQCGYNGNPLIFLKKGDCLKKKIISLLTSVALVFAITAALGFSASAADANSSAGIVATSSTALNVRSSASTSSAVVKTLSKGSYVTLTAKSGSWWQVEYANGKYGYCHASYINQVSSTAKEVKLTSGVLNVRTGSGTSYSVKDTLANGKTVLVLSQSNGWSKILYNGTSTGYVSSTYLADNSSAQSYRSVYLSVPDYKQTDSRWASVYLGSSGKTIGNIGCTTTTLAMTESYRTGQTVYPDAMSKKLTYDKSGSLYWPSNYVISTSSSNYLSTVYNLLKQGKPVIIGAKNSAGKQHWVVVKGFNSGSLSAENFIINDPATSSRTSLKQFLSVYPNFYKMAYYK